MPNSLSAGFHGACADGREWMAVGPSKLLVDEVGAMLQLASSYARQPRNLFYFIV
jgi:hypothetical protein